MSDYQAIFYGVHRTSTMKSIRPSLDASSRSGRRSCCILPGSDRRRCAPRAALLHGGNTTPSIATEGWHPHQFFAIQPAELLREYADYRATSSIWRPMPGAERPIGRTRCNAFSIRLDVSCSDALAGRHGLSHSAIHAPRHDIPTNHRRDLEHLHPSFRRSRGRSESTISLAPWHYWTWHTGRFSIFIASLASTPNSDFRESSMSG